MFCTRVDLTPSLWIGTNEDSDEDLESIHKGVEDLAGYSATKRRRARKILRTPEKKVSVSHL